MSKSWERHRGEVVRGFTLVELVIVMVIIGVVGAIAVPRFSQANSRTQLRAAADRVISDLELARTRARSASQTCTVSFDPIAESYTLSAVGGPEKTVQLNESPYGVKIREANFNSSTDVQFNGYGELASAGTVTLELGSDSVTVKLGSNGEATR